MNEERAREGEGVCVCVVGVMGGRCACVDVCADMGWVQSSITATLRLRLLSFVIDYDSISVILS